jgi:hypothetical protein
MTTPFSTAVSATFVDDGAGSTIASAIIGPPTALAGWRIRRITSNTNNTSSVFSVLKLYQNFVSPSQYLDGSRNADADTSETDLILQPGENLTAVWTKGPLGVIATLTVSGELIT